MSQRNWVSLIEGEMRRHGETWSDCVYRVSGPTTRAKFNHACDPEEPLEVTGFAGFFDSGCGGVEGDAFTVWTANRVYFPAQYDGAEWCASVPRNPCDEATQHVGGG